MQELDLRALAKEAMGKVDKEVQSQRLDQTLKVLAANAAAKANAVVTPTTKQWVEKREKP